MSETKATITISEWRDQVNYKKTDGWKIVTINDSAGTVVIRKSTREKWNHNDMVHTDRKRMYRSQVKDGNYEFLRAEMSENVLSTTELDKLQKEGRDPRTKLHKGQKLGGDLDHSTAYTRPAKSEQ